MGYDDCPIALRNTWIDQPDSPPPASTSNPSPSNALVGTWQTADLPTGKPSAGATRRLSIKVGETSFVEFEQQGEDTPQAGWSGTYTMRGDAVDPLSEDGVCHIILATALHGDTLRLSLVKVSPGNLPNCGAGDVEAWKDIAESAPFQRTT